VIWDRELMRELRRRAPDPSASTPEVELDSH
jgi:hypothetical protein